LDHVITSIKHPSFTLFSSTPVSATTIPSASVPIATRVRDRSSQPFFKVPLRYRRGAGSGVAGDAISRRGGITGN